MRRMIGPKQLTIAGRIECSSALAIEALGLPRAAGARVRFEGSDSLPSTFAVTAFASAAIGMAALAVSEFGEMATDRSSRSLIDEKLSTLAGLSDECWKRRLRSARWPQS